MFSALLVGFLGTAGADQWHQHPVPTRPGDLHRGVVESYDYAKGTPLFHDNFSPYDYNYYHERRHRITVLQEQQKMLKQREWEGKEKSNAKAAFDYKKQNQGGLSENPTSPYGSSPNNRNMPTVSYTAPDHYPDDYQQSGLSVQYPQQALQQPPPFAIPGHYSVVPPDPYMTVPPHPYMTVPGAFR